MAASGQDLDSLPLLPHLSLNETGQSTILLLHGLCSSPVEYAAVHPHLTAPAADDSTYDFTTYHILAPYLPAHGLASSITPFSLPYAAELVAHLIRVKAKEGKAHVVGLSGGGFVSLYLARQYPSLVSSLFATGVGGLVGRTSLIAYAPYLLISVLGLQYSAPEFAYQWMQRRWKLQIPDGLREEMWANSKLAMLKEAYESLDRDGIPVPLSIRALIIAGGKGDSVEGTKAYAKEVKKGNEFSQACVVNDAIHAWDLQFPELFAKGVRAWIQQTKLPWEYEILDII